MPLREKGRYFAGTRANQANHSCSNAGMLRTLIFFLCVLPALPALGQQNPGPVKKAIESWLATHTQGLPGQVSWEIGGIDPGNQLAPCTRFDIGRTAGARSWGRTNLVVRCLGEANWRVYVPVNIRVKADYLISVRPIAQGQIIAADDLASEPGDLSELPGNILTDVAAAIGKVAAASIPAGKPLRDDMLRLRTVIRQGQTVKIISRGPGFAVANEGRALANAHPGQVVQVRLGNGQVVSGVANADGSAEVTR